MTQFNLPDGLYKARVRQCFISSTTDNQKYVQVDFEVHRRGEECWNVLWRKKIRNGKTVSEEILDEELTNKVKELLQKKLNNV